MVEDRIAALEARAATLEDARARARGAPRPTRRRAPAAIGAPASPAAVAPPPPRARRARRATRPAAAAPAAPPTAPRPQRDLEDFLGGSVLAWLGGFAVLAGLAFLLTIAISRGWIGEGARTLLAGALSLGLLGAGVWLREHRGRTEAALAAAAVGIAGPVRHARRRRPGLRARPARRSRCSARSRPAPSRRALAIRWRAQVMGWLGLLGALWAPAALGALDGGGIVFLAIAYAATIAVLVWQRWTALAAAAFAVDDAAVARVGAVRRRRRAALALVVFGALTAALALGLEAQPPRPAPGRDRPEARARPHPFAVALLVLNAALLARRRLGRARRRAVARRARRRAHRARPRRHARARASRASSR